MTETFTYSILQYRHSLLLREAINVGILFSFPQQEQIEFVSGNFYRVKSIYPNFDQSLYNAIVRNIENTIKQEARSLFANNFNKGLKEFIHTSLLPEDSTVLQFTDPTTVVNTFSEIRKTVKVYSELLLPGIVTSKAEEIRHNETFLIKRYFEYIFENRTDISERAVLQNRIRRNTIVEHKGLKLKFDAAWQNGTLNLVKPVSFDLKEEQDIHNKSAQYYGILNLLKKKGTDEKYRYDILVAKPQDPSLIDSYNEAISILREADSPKRIITEAELQTYSEETISNLLKQSSNELRKQ